MALPYWTSNDIEDRVGIDAALAVLDRNNDGELDGSAVGRLQRDSDSRVEVYLRAGGYPIDIVRAVKPTMVVTLSLDAANVYVWKNAPDHVRGDWKELEDRLMKTMEAIAAGDIDLGLPDIPEPGVVTNSGMAAVSDLLRGW